jgi:hypothetical protein
MPAAPIRIVVIAATLLLLPDAARTADNDPALALEKEFGSSVQPLLKKFCFECHSGDTTEAEIDLGEFSTLADLRKQTKVWVKVRTMLDTGQMPPKDSPKPSDDERTKLRGWVKTFLLGEAKKHAGDPGPVILRRLSNDEYNYTVRDLTGVTSLNPTQEFPVDGAAGEGFINSGAAQAMSPSLVTKYLDAGKAVADHAVLLPDGISFSPYVTRRDRTDELAARIQAFYRQFTTEGGGQAVNLQGIQFDTNQGGVLPIQKYLAATLEERDSISGGKKTVEQVAKERGLNAKYLEILWTALTPSLLPPAGGEGGRRPDEGGQASDQKSKRTPNSPSPALRAPSPPDGGRGDGSPLLDRIQAEWQRAKPEDVGKLVAMIAEQQKVLFRFNSIGHIGGEGKPKIWMEPVTPMAARRDFSLKLPDGAASDVSVFLSAADADDGNSQDFVVWQNPRLVRENGADVPLRDLAGLQIRMRQLQREALSKTTTYLTAVSEYVAETGEPEKKLAALATKHKLDTAALQVWLNYLSLNESGSVEVKGHLTTKTTNPTYNFIKGYGVPETPVFLSNASDNEVRIPGIARPHQIQVHPSPTLFIAAGWRSPISGLVKVEARLSDAHPECGNGQEWIVQHRTVKKVGNLWQGDFATRGSAKMEPKSISVRKGELISFIVGPRQGNHSCDLTEINLTITELSDKKRTWDLAKDVSSTIQSANPHPDRHGNAKTWHFYQGPMTEVNQKAGEFVSVPAGSFLARWQDEKDAGKRSDLAAQVQKLATGEAPADKTSADGVLYEQLMGLAMAPRDLDALLTDVEPDERFGKHPLGHKMNSSDLVVHAPAVVEFRIPAKLAAGRTLVVGGTLDAKDGREGSVRIEASLARVEPAAIPLGSPVLTNDGSKSRDRVVASFRKFHELFPPNLCYARIVPVDEVVTLTLYYRQDDALQRLMLNEKQIAEINRLWDELLFVAQEPLRFEVAFEQIREFATQDRPDLVKVWDPLKKGVVERAAAFRKRLVDTEPLHLNAAIDFAARAWRHPLSNTEQAALRSLYQKLREAEIPHDQSIRLTLARVLTSPVFLYRREQQPDGTNAVAVSNFELATRLSYFLWSSAPDEELIDFASDGRLTRGRRPGAGGPDKTDDSDGLASGHGLNVLRGQTKRMLADPRTRRLAIQFACQWLHLRNFDQNDEKNEKLYPEFAKLRGDMYEETVRFFEDMFRHDGSILDLLDADHTFLNEELARHYGIKFQKVAGQDWQKVGGARAMGRGGILSMATFLASQSGASRTSPILRGNWVSETLLGEKLPKPPVGVPVLPEEVPTGLTARQLIEKHSSAPACAKCHARIDPYGFALEQFDVLGRLRPQKVDTKTTLLGGEQIEGLAGLREYLLTKRKDDVVRQFCKKLLGFALGREVQLSDEVLLAEMQKKLEENGYRFSVAVYAVVTSRQFREIRGAAFNP